MNPQKTSQKGLQGQKVGKIQLLKGYIKYDGCISFTLVIQKASSQGTSAYFLVFGSGFSVSICAAGLCSSLPIRDYSWDLVHFQVNCCQSPAPTIQHCAGHLQRQPILIPIDSRCPVGYPNNIMQLCYFG